MPYFSDSTSSVSVDSSDDEIYRPKPQQCRREDLSYRRIDDSAKEVRDTPSITDATTSPPTVKDEKLKFVRCSKVLPKYVSNQKEEIFSSELIEEATDKVFLENELSSNLHNYSQADRPRFLIGKLENHPKDPFSIILRVEGRRDLVDELLKVLVKRICTIQARENAVAILTDKESLEIDVKVDVTMDLGFKLVKPPLMSQGGLWISSTSAGGQIYNIFGHSINRGAVLVKIGKERLFKLKDKNRCIDNAKDIYSTSGKKADKFIQITICLPRNSNIRKLERNKRVIYPIRFRDGTVYKQFRKATKNALHSARNEQKNMLPPSAKKRCSKKIRLHKKTRSEPSTTTKPERCIKRNVKIFSKAKKMPIKDNLKKKQKSAASSSYFHFQEKIHTAQSIEYGGLDIHRNSIISSMWNRHKIKFGDSCSKNCPCVCDLQYLASNVITDITESQEQNVNTKPFPVGFINNFCRKFFKKVKESFPKDSPADTLEKLVMIWNEHRKQRNFGVKCKKECPCLDGWKVFLHICTAANDVKDSLPSGNTLQLMIRDKKKIEKSNAEKFSIIFNPLKESLGLFCSTVKGSNGISQCVIKSFDSKGVAKIKDQRILIGTVITAYSTLSTLCQQNKIESYTTLERIYNVLKQKEQPNIRLKLYFMNAGDIESQDSQPKDHWSALGAWLGKLEDGWAGGAMYATNYNEAVNEKRILTSSKVSYEPLPKKCKLLPPVKNDSLLSACITSSSKHHPSKSSGGPGKKANILFNANSNKKNRYATTLRVQSTTGICGGKRSVTALYDLTLNENKSNMQKQNSPPIEIFVPAVCNLNSDRVKSNNLSMSTSTVSTSAPTQTKHYSSSEKRFESTKGEKRLFPSIPMVLTSARKTSSILKRPSSESSRKGTAKSVRFSKSNTYYSESSLHESHSGGIGKAYFAPSSVLLKI